MTHDVATRETVRFVREWTQRWPAPRVLEIGCGDGEVAAALQSEGARVVALDASAEAVQAARGRGVDARRVTWPDFAAASPSGAGGPFDVVAFTRSLHHIARLDEAIGKAHEVLAVGGVLLAEEFTYDAFDDRTARWFGGLLRELDAAGVVFAPDSFCAAMLISQSGLDAWLADHGHELHTADTMMQAIERRFDQVTMEDTPYLYRYLRQALPRGAQREWLEVVWQNERSVGRQLPGFYIGRRFIAEKR